MSIFVNRTEEIDRIQRGLDAGESFAIFGMRKIGKTSLMEEVKRRADGDKVGTHMVKCSACDCFEDVLVDVVKAIRDYGRIHGFLGRLVEAPEKLIEKINGLRKYRGTQKVRAGEHVIRRVQASAGSGSLWPFMVDVAAGQQTEYDLVEVEKELYEIRQDLIGALDALEKKKLRFILFIDEFGIYQWTGHEGYDFFYVATTADFFKPLIENTRGTLSVVLAASINVRALSPRGIPGKPIDLGPFSDMGNDEMEDPSLELIAGLTREVLGKSIDGKLMLEIKKESHRMPYYIGRFVNEMVNMNEPYNIENIKRKVMERVIREDVTQIRSQYSSEWIRHIRAIAAGAVVDRREFEESYLELSGLVSLEGGRWKFTDPLLREAILVEGGRR